MRPQPESHVEALTLRTSERTLFRNRVAANAVNSEALPCSSMVGVVIKGEVGRQIHRKGTSCRDEGRDQEDASASQGVAKMASKSPEAGRGMGQIFPHSPQNEPIHKCLHFGIQTYEAFLLFKVLLSGNLLWKPQKVNLDTDILINRNKSQRKLSTSCCQ